MTDQLLIIFAKNPRLGNAKTRLAASVGPQAALMIYQQLLDHTRKITKDLPIDKVLFYSESPWPSEFWGDRYRHKKQSGGDLGDKMLEAFQWGFEQGYGRVCIIGSDCWELTAELVMQAFDLLNDQQVVLGPTYDGGYYLLGMNELHSILFQNKTWSSSKVLEETTEDLKRYGLCYKQLTVLNDVDAKQDLPQALKALLP